MSGSPREPSRPDAGGRGDELAIVVLFLISALAALGLAVLYWRGGQVQVEGVLLAIAAGCIGIGLILWSHRLLPNAEQVEDREALSGSAEERAAFDEDLQYGHVFTRRALLRASLGTSVVALGIAFLFPLRSLGPRPTDAALNDTPWRPGRRLIGSDGRPVRLADVPQDSLVTVFPDGALNSETGQAVLVRVDPTLLQPLPGRAHWSPRGLVAYSKVCTHAGCPVGLYEASTHQLLCPCHQSTFNVLDGAKPIFGPAAQRLPQLPLAVDADGYIYATGGFSEPPGPSFWNRPV
ncbi:MAG TPA: Rieske 2Fe-2S domain-containing protein [Acidimicrobiia bacterium]|jgi:ubiquinol-cytochrome c reductase iron-sulfur subunit